MYQHGLTLIELLIVLVIVAVVINTAFPEYSGLRQKNLIQTTSNSFYEEMQLARNYAIARNARVTMAHKGTWSKGWDIYEDTNNNGKRDDEERILQSNNGFGDIEIIPNRYVANYISFTGSGRTRLHSPNSTGAVQMGTFYVCHKNQNNFSLQLTLSRGGRVNMLKINENPCQTE